MTTKAEKIVAGLGGIENLEKVQSGNITDLQVEVVNPALGEILLC